MGVAYTIGVAQGPPCHAALLDGVKFPYNPNRDDHIGYKLGSVWYVKTESDLVLIDNAYKWGVQRPCPATCCIEYEVIGVWQRNVWALSATPHFAKRLLYNDEET
jgi:hypothetical protein